LRIHLTGKKRNQNEKCPVYESEKYIFTIVEEQDGKDLSVCYSGPESLKYFNSDNCLKNFYYSQLKKWRRK
jgi:hypothetical protein